MTFWDRFYTLCEKAGTKPNPVAKELGFSSAVCSHWKGGAVPSGDSVVKIADYFNVSTDYLLKGVEYSGADKQVDELSKQDVKYALYGDPDFDDDAFEEVIGLAEIQKKLRGK